MEATMEELIGTTQNTPTHIIARGKRTKRQRPPSPLGVSVTSSSSTAGCSAVAGGGGGGGGGEDCPSVLSPAITSSSDISNAEEEEDMANCLILLAQGAGHRRRRKKIGEENSGSRKLTENVSAAAATTINSCDKIYVYECKTCSRTFPSFQALGGHRASHKKPKNLIEDKKITTTTTDVATETTSSENEDDHRIAKIQKIINIPNSSISLQIPNHRHHKSVNYGSIKGNKIHECSICGSEFSSGQALGGHMRRHRAPPTTAARVISAADTSFTAAAESHDSGEPRHVVLSLDLNLPAPEDDHCDSNFQFSSSQPRLVFSAPTLVDCHY